MFGWLFRKWAVNKQMKEAEDFLSRMKSMNDDELGWPTALTFEAAKMVMEDRSVDVFDPYVAVHMDPEVTFYLSNMVGQLQKMGRQAVCPGVMVWVHTLRSASNHKVRNLVRKIWSELKRGEPYAEDARHELMSAFQMWPNLDRLGEVPKGMEARS